MHLAIKYLDANFAPMSQHAFNVRKGRYLKWELARIAMKAVKHVQLQLQPQLAQAVKPQHFLMPIMNVWCVILPAQLARVLRPMSASFVRKATLWWHRQ